MASLRCSLQGRYFVGLLSGLKKGLFEGDETCTKAALAESLYAESGLANDVVMAEIESFEQLLRTAARHDYDPSQIEEISTNGELSEEQSRLLSTFWRNERAKIHDKVHKTTVWHNHLKTLSWRVDTKIAQTHSAGTTQELNEPTAIFELHHTPGINTTTTEGSIARFEMSKEQITNLLEQFQQIQSKIESFV